MQPPKDQIFLSPQALIKEVGNRRAERLSASSLTRLLKEAPGEFNLELLFVGRQNLTAKARIGNEQAGDYLMREVYLSLEGKRCVFARSVLLHEGNIWINIIDSGDRPLGEHIFAIPGVKRSTFTFYRLPPFFFSGIGQRLIARQSLFNKEGQSLLLTECFLPNFEKITWND